MKLVGALDRPAVDVIGRAILRDASAQRAIGCNGGCEGGMATLRVV